MNLNGLKSKILKIGAILLIIAILRGKCFIMLYEIYGNKIKYSNCCHCALYFWGGTIDIVEAIFSKILSGSEKSRIQVESLVRDIVSIRRLLVIHPRFTPGLLHLEGFDGSIFVVGIAQALNDC